MRVMFWLRTAVLLGMLAAACGDTDEQPTAASEVEDVADDPTPLPMPEWCIPATPEDVEFITQHLAGTGNHLVDAFTTTDANGNRLIMANLDSATGERITSADVWVITPDGQAYALSSGARDQSILPDGTTIASPGDPAVTPLVDCLTASAQQRNLG